MHYPQSSLSPKSFAVTIKRDRSIYINSDRDAYLDLLDILLLQVSARLYGPLIESTFSWNEPASFSIEVFFWASSLTNAPRKLGLLSSRSVFSPVDDMESHRIAAKNPMEQHLFRWSVLRHLFKKSIHNSLRNVLEPTSEAGTIGFTLLQFVHGWT
ncbi:hypothetical protein EV356DRAFT_369848 [Viridothelium virens]|uniref:Uncharacterized protein n=1 Tax=Viridothelium virens TaxID=1048519 RepID=A0A6A6GWF0_VIRVR|nr:hypothetical protein EV356DRAFT_369848 [Viridothelium virens]